MTWKSGEKHPKDAEEFKEFLKNDCPIMRFWTIVGRINLKEKSATTNLQLLLECDKEVVNRILAALAIWTINKDDKARNFLKNIRDKFIKSVEPKASASKVPHLKAFTEGTLAIIDKKCF